MGLEATGKRGGERGGRVGQNLKRRGVGNIGESS